MTSSQAPSPLAPFKSVSYAGKSAGSRLIVTGAVHGNEVCGPLAIRRVMAEIDEGRLRIARGVLTLVPVCNALAHQRGTREGERNLNRALMPTPSPRQYEDHVANWLCPLLAQHEVLLDLHSFRMPGKPFVLVGPRDNTGAIEPFSQSAKEEALARRLGVDRAVDGWLATYARGVERRRAAAGPAVDSWDLNPRYGVGTTEYMRSQGGMALTLECGEHGDPRAPEVGYQAIRRTLAHLRLTDEVPPQEVRPIEALSIQEVVDKQHDDDSFVRDWQSFDRLRAGERIGTRADGQAVYAPADSWMLFPDGTARARDAWFYLAGASTRF
ncbi:succinylglutamate desuccinylase/aspartoacylase domain-containing protein [Aquabacterium sp.]|uniref:succinylglutamate desuccinylase/aspartoacylase domain-containing protein n=1 Tax=Aquabacterium sp. TaxID=1872578 RepID=UPI002CB7E894|nr:succinylglutamate desuccinylase/aspartoacylase family protein [Aquabacterium sp.]HSW03831.1 succinylglutamate desuccinylase/aspartoacylase family protein [Aquabacterium sp.]